MKKEIQERILSEETRIRNELKRGFIYGVLVGLLMGFIDTYGYATTGYTTAEISLVITPILVRIILGRRSSLRSIVAGSVAAYGISFSTIITSGMLITNAYTKYVYERFFYGTDFPTWLYSREGCFYGILCSYMPTYVFIGLLSLSGVLLAYLYRHVFIDKMNLPYPIAVTSFIISGFLNNIRNFRGIYRAILIGFILQLLVFIFNEPSIDLSSDLNTIIKGSVMALSLNFIILFISMIIPPRTSASIGLSSILAALLILPLGYSLRLFELGGGEVGIDNIMYHASWYEASVIFGSVMTIAFLYVYKLRDAITSISRISLKGRDAILFVLMILGFISLFLATYLYARQPITYEYIIFSLVWVLILLPILIMVTTIAVGEAGIAAQSLYPFNTVYLYVTGFRGFTPYVFMDHYLGIPMPGSLSGATGNIIKLSRMLRVSVVKLLSIFVISFLIGLQTTLFYGVILLDYIFRPETNPTSLIRWLPYVNWSILVYKGQLDLSVLGGGILVGFLYMLSILLVGLVTPLRVSPIPFIIGFSLTPDYGILFLLGSFIRLFVSRFGIEAQERISIYATALLVGSGLSIPVYTLISAFTGSG
ncbi:MAG: hypothetical protein QXQ36_01865 [Sulfolobales archaeon]